MADKWAYEKDAAAFDTSDLGRAELRRLDVPRGEPKSSLAVRFDAADLERLRQRAAAEGVGVTQLVRRWVQERLDEQEPAGAVDELMEALQKGMQAARTIRRSTSRRVS